MGGCKFRISAFLILLFLGAGSYKNPIYGQTTSEEKTWHFLAEPYLMFPYMDGETGIGNNLILPVDATPADIFSKLQMGAMLYMEAKTDKWMITSDLVYMKLNQELTPGILLHEGDVTAKQLIWEIAGLYRLIPGLDVGVGGRVNFLQTSVDGWVNVFPVGIEPVSGKQDKTWFDPVLIARFNTDVNDRWLIQIRGDLGGFGVGSDFTWQLQAYAGYRFSKLFQITAGYRIISIDYDKGENLNRFVFDMNEFGPVVRFGFEF